MRISKRLSLAFATATLLTVTVTGIASACNLTAKTIDTEAGSCTAAGGAPCSGAALYGANGFTGTLTFSSTGTTTIWDFICVHAPSAPAGTFTTFGGTYHLSLFNGASQLGSTATYAVVGGQPCNLGSKYSESGAGVSLTVPASLQVQYQVTIDGVTAGSSAQAAFGGSDSLRNDALDTTWAHTYSVTPPTNFIIPEAPFAVLLPLTGLAAAGFVLRRPRKVAAQIA